MDRLSRSTVAEHQPTSLCATRCGDLVHVHERSGGQCRGGEGDTETPRLTFGYRSFKAAEEKFPDLI